jgi:hypothetical protein
MRNTPEDHPLLHLDRARQIPLERARQKAAEKRQELAKKLQKARRKRQKDAEKRRLEAAQDEAARERLARATRARFEAIEKQRQTEEARQQAAAQAAIRKAAREAARQARAAAIRAQEAEQAATLEKFHQVQEDPARRAREAQAARLHLFCQSLYTEWGSLANQQRLATLRGIHRLEEACPDVPFWQMEETELWGCLTARRPGPRDRGQTYAR